MKPSPEELGFKARFNIPILLGPALNPINTTMISVALVPIANDCGVSTATCIWLVAALYLVSSVCQPMMGKVCDQYGPRRVYLSGLLVVMVAGILPSLNATFLSALISRILIGFGTSCCYPSTMSFIRDQSARLDRVVPQALLSGVAISSMVTSCIGPVLGGLLLKFFPWQSIFIVNIPIAFVAFVLAAIWLPADSTRPSRPQTQSLVQAIDPIGIILFSGTIVALLVFLLDLRSLLFWVLIISICSAISLILWERHHENPFIDVRMLASNRPLVKTYLRLILMTTTTYFMVYGLIQWSESQMGVATDMAGIIQIPASVLSFICSFMVLRSKKLRAPLSAAAGAPLVAGVLMLFLHADSSIIMLVMIISLFGIPNGLNNLSNQAALYTQAPEKYLGTAAGLSRTSMHLAAILSSGIIGILFSPVTNDASCHNMAFIIIVISTVALILTLTDKSLRKAEKR